MAIERRQRATERAVRRARCFEQDIEAQCVDEFGLGAVFQHGWLGGVFGVNRPGPIEAFLPVMLFAILFGLSMDYEVFILARMREEYDATGSTDFIIRSVDEAPPGSVIGVGTEIHLVKRLDDEHPDKTVVSLDPLVCPCSTMFRIDAAHLCWVLEELVGGRVVNRITVDPSVAEGARLALQRMLDIT